MQDGAPGSPPLWRLSEAETEELQPDSKPVKHHRLEMLAEGQRDSMLAEYD